MIDAALLTEFLERIRGELPSVVGYERRRVPVSCEELRQLPNRGLSRGS